MLIATILFFAIITAIIFSERKKNKQANTERHEQEERKALLEAVLKNNKDRHID